MHLSYAFHVFCSDDGCLAGTLVCNDITQMNDAIANDDVQTNGRPVGLLHRVNNAISNVVIIGGRIRDVARQARYRLQQISRE